METRMISKRVKTALFTLVTALALSLVTVLSVQSDPPEVSFDGLHLQESEKAAIVYAKPDADLSVYKRFMLLDAYVAFRKNWQRDTKVGGRRVSNKDMERIKTEVAKLFHETFQETMEEDDGYQLVDKPDDDVLIFRPAIIDLDITAPDIPVAGRVTNYVASAGEATLYLELFDSVSGEILMRIVDRKAMRNYGYARWANSVTNRQDARKLFKGWAGMLREGMDSIHKKAKQATGTSTESSEAN
jgi:hypothetical protein